MDDCGRYDILLADAAEHRRQQWKAALHAHLSARVVAQSSARAAITSFSNAQFHALVCGTDLGDLDCWRLICMVRSGRFGFPDIPVFIVCESHELEALEPMLDVYSSLIELKSGDRIAADIAARLSRRSKHSVLIIEDEPAAADVAFQALEKYFRVEIAHEGIAGLEAWRRTRQDLVLLDLMLPGMTGAQVLSQIKQTQPEQAVIVLTAMDALDTHQDLILAGASEFLTKPVNTHLLASICARVLREKHCLRNAQVAKQRAAAFDTLAARLHAAEFNLSCGRTAEARTHLSHAIFNCRAQGPTDDQWLQLLAALSPPTTAR